jgi:hypothetical protein
MAEIRDVGAIQERHFVRLFSSLEVAVSERHSRFLGVVASHQKGFLPQSFVVQQLYLEAWFFHSRIALQ